MSNTATTIQLIAQILEAVMSDIPLLVQVVEAIIPVFKENREPTAAEWDALQELLDQTHSDLQASIQAELAKLSTN